MRCILVVLVVVVMMQFLRDAFTLQFLFRLDGRIYVCGEFGFGIDEECRACLVSSQSVGT